MKNRNVNNILHSLGKFFGLVAACPFGQGKDVKIMRKITFRRLCGLAAAGSFVMLLGTAGCIDNMTLDGAEALHRLLSQGAAFIACARCAMG